MKYFKAFNHFFNSVHCYHLKFLISFLLFALLFISCKENNIQQKHTQDSLLVVLNTQVFQLNQLPQFNKENFSITDTLSHTDSLLYQNLHTNYQNAIQIMDSIHIILQKSMAEADTLNKYKNITDTSVIRRLKHLTYIHQNYLQEYYKALSIAEQNKPLLQLITKQ